MNEPISIVSEHMHRFVNHLFASDHVHRLTEPHVGNNILCSPMHEASLRPCPIRRGYFSEMLFPTCQVPTWIGPYAPHRNGPYASVCQATDLVCTKKSSIGPYHSICQPTDLVCTKRSRIEPHAPPRIGSYASVCQPTDLVCKKKNCIGPYHMLRFVN